MKTYLGSKAIFVKNDDKLVYIVESMEIYDGYEILEKCPIEI